MPEPADPKRPILEHLSELRVRVIIGLLAMLPGTALGWAFAPALLDAFLEPLRSGYHRQGLGQATIHFANPLDQVVAYMHMSLAAGVLVGMPVIAWQAWAFVAPGLFVHEKRYAVPFVLGATICFAGGAYFGFAVVFPSVFDTVLGLSGDIGAIRVQPTIMLSEYMGFATQMLLAFGVVFEVPVVVLGGAVTGLFTWRQLLSFGRYWIVAASILAALLTPPDVGSQLLMLVPLVALYYASVAVAYLLARRDEKRASGKPDAVRALEARFGQHPYPDPALPSDNSGEAP